MLVTIIDDDLLQLQVLNKALRRYTDWHVVTMEATATDLVAWCTEAAVPLPEDPDVILLDYHLGEGKGLRLIGPLQQQCPHARIYGLSGIDSDPIRQRCLQAGASGFLVKPTDLAGIRALVGRLETDARLDPA